MVLARRVKREKKVRHLVEKFPKTFLLSKIQPFFMNVSMLFHFTEITLERLLSIKGNFRLLTINSFESSLKCTTEVLEIPTI